MGIFSLGNRSTSVFLRVVESVVYYANVTYAISEIHRQLQLKQQPTRVLEYMKLVCSQCRSMLSRRDSCAVCGEERDALKVPEGILPSENGRHPSFLQNCARKFLLLYL